MKILVTGASGFIGSSLIEQLGALRNGAGHEIFALMRETSNPTNLKDLRYKKVIGSLGDPKSLEKAVKGMDVVYHLAGVTAARNREEYFANNAQGTANLAQAVSKKCPGLRRFVYVSSIAAGGPTASLTPKKESDASEPVSFYGASKLQGERELNQLKSQFPISIVRPPMVYGPREQDIFLMIQSVARNFMPILKGSTQDGQKHYSVIHAEDLCRGLIQAGTVSCPSGEVFYLSGDGIYTYQDIMGTIAKTLHKKPFRLMIPKFGIRAAALACSALGAITRQPFALNLDKVNEILPDYWICSNQKAKKMLGFAPKYDLSTGMEQTIDWYKKNKWI